MFNEYLWTGVLNLVGIIGHIIIAGNWIGRHFQNVKTQHTQL